MDENKVYTIAEAARELRVSVRWLTAQCRSGRVEHLHMAGRRRLTAQQLEDVKAANTVTKGQKAKPHKKVPPPRSPRTGAVTRSTATQDATASQDEP